MLKIAKSNKYKGSYYSTTGNYTISKRAVDDNDIENVIQHEEIHRIIHERVGLKESKQFDKICKILLDSYYYEDYEGYLY